MLQKEYLEQCQKRCPDMAVTYFNPEEEYRNMKSYLINLAERKAVVSKNTIKSKTV